MTRRRRIAWSTGFVATLLGSTGLYLTTTVITAQAGVGPGTVPSAPAVQGTALGPAAYPVDMSAPQIARLEVLPPETTEATTSTADLSTEAWAPIIAGIGVRQPISLFPAWAYGGIIWRAAPPSSSGNGWARAEVLLATEAAGAAPEAGDRSAEAFATGAPRFAAELGARQPIALFPAGLYAAGTRPATLADFAAEALARLEGIATELGTAAPDLADQPVRTAALAITSDRYAKSVSPAGLYGGVIRPAALPTSTGAALARAEALITAGLQGPDTEDPDLLKRHPVSPALVVLPERLTGVGDPSSTEVDTPQVFADSRPLASADLDELRGGVFDVNGWKIAFGVSLDVKLDQDFKISTFLNPVTKRGGFSLRVGDNQLVRNEDGSIRTQGNPAITNGPNGTTFKFGAFAANVRETDEGFDLSTDGDRPVVLSQNPAQVVQVVGSEARTLVRHQLSPGEIIAQLNNIQNDGRTSSVATIAIDILNHDQRVSVSRTLRHAEDLNRLIAAQIMGHLGR